MSDYCPRCQEARDSWDKSFLTAPVASAPIEPKPTKHFGLPDYRRYLCYYKFEGETWPFIIEALDRPDAERRSAALTSVFICGEYISARPDNWFIRFLSLFDSKKTIVAGK
jgi:hypothetical protein